MLTFIRALTWSLGLVLQSPSNSAVVTTAAIRLNWDAPPGCPSPTEFARAVARSVDAELALELEPSTEAAQPALDELARTRAHAQVWTLDDRWLLRVEIDNEWGSSAREFELRSCASAAELAVLAIGFALDPERIEAGTGLVPPRPRPPIQRPRTRRPPRVEVVRPPEPSRPAPEPEPRPSLASADPPRSSPELVTFGELYVEAPRPPSHYALGPQTPPPRVAALVRLGGGLTLGPVTDGATGHLDLALGARGKGWRLEAIGGHDGRSPEVGIGEPSYGFRYARWRGQLRVCAAPELGVVEFGLCAGFEAGQLTLRPDSGTIRLPWMAVVPSLALAIRLHRHVAIVPELAVPASLVRAQFEAGFDEVARIAAAEFRTLFSVEVRLP